MSKLRVLVGGERFGIIRDAFIRAGHDAVSCDFARTEVPGPHYQGDWRDIEGDGWDLAIFHRTCTFMANSGAKHLYKDMKKENGINRDRFIACLEDAWAFWDHKERCPIPFVAWENPVMLGYAQLMVGKPDQTVQPWWFGNDEDGPDNVKKAVCWWLRRLPKLRRTGTLDGTTAREEVFRMARSKFFPGMADALVDQWGGFVACYKSGVSAEADTGNVTDAGLFGHAILQSLEVRP